jgi:ribosomal-protein-serine acetyltransferase
MKLHEFDQLADEDICLKPVNSGDAEALFRLIDRDRAYLREWLPWVDHSRSVQDTLKFIELSQEKFERKEAFSVCITHQNKIAGIIGFHYFDWSNRSTSIGYWLAQDFQGKGITTRSCALLVNYAFVELGLNRVEIRCAVKNKKSRAIPEKLNFRNEGTVRDGE